VDTTLLFDEPRRRSLINEDAEAASGAPKAGIFATNPRLTADDCSLSAQ
jgi:hypothetical protein